jgi:hypothetical protein
MTALPGLMGARFLSDDVRNYVEINPQVTPAHISNFGDVYVSNMISTTFCKGEL